MDDEDGFIWADDGDEEENPTADDNEGLDDHNVNPTGPTENGDSPASETDGGHTLNEYHGTDDNTPEEPDPTPDSDVHSEDPSDTNGDGHDNGSPPTSDSDDSSDDQPEEVIPELHPNVYRDPFEGYDVSDVNELAAAVSEIDRTAGVTIQQLINKAETLEQQVDEYKEKAKEQQQRFQEFRQRKNNETEEIKDTATKEFIRRILPVRDDLERAIEQESEDIKEGVEIVCREFDGLLEEEGVTIIDPQAGTEVDPDIHEVMTQVESDVPDGRVEGCYRPGYKMNDVLIRPARVTVSVSQET